MDVEHSMLARVAFVPLPFGRILICESLMSVSSFQGLRQVKFCIVYTLRGFLWGGRSFFISLWLSMMIDLSIRFSFYCLFHKAFVQIINLITKL